MNFFYGLLLLVASTFSDLRVTSSEDADSHFVNSWAAEITGGPEVARQVAEQHGYRIVRSLDFIADHYVLERSDTPNRSRRSADHHTRKLSDDNRVLYAEQQQHRSRVKRELLYDDDVTKRVASDDPEYENQWYLNQEDISTPRREKTHTDLKVRGPWIRNITGRGVTVTIVDDGLEHGHPDLKSNYDPNASFDFNMNNPDPQPRYDITNENKHGTRCAGEVAMAADNKVCGIGIAFNSNIGGIKILDGKVTDVIESSALSYKRDHIDIYSSSWGPSDDGRTCEGPGKLTRKALDDGVRLGRKGKGSIFIVAAGNGGASGDNCNCDGYTSSISTISVNSCSQNGFMPYYAERCASTLTSAFSSGSYSEGKVITTDLHHKCTNGHSGTSAAAPMIAGISALVLEVNPTLTWRDLQHIFAHTSNMRSLDDNGGWYRNGAGYCVNLAFGFGIADADAATRMADPRTFKPVGKQRICKIEAVEPNNFPIEFRSGESVKVEFKTDGCQGQENEVNFMEHFQAIVSISYPKRGNIYVESTSPAGTTTALMLERRNDASTAGFRHWALTSVHNWGENPRGTWEVQVADRSDDNFTGTVDSISIVLYGTKEQPEHQKNMPKLCEHLKQYADTLTNVISENRDSGRPTHTSSLKANLDKLIHPASPKVSTQRTPQESPDKSSVESIKELFRSFSRG